MPQIYNYAPALASYIQGADLSEVSKMTMIPLQSLNQTAAAQNWAALRVTFQQERAALLSPAEDAEVILGLQRHNRQICRKEVDKLRTVANRWLKRFEDDPTLAPTGKELRDFACSLATIHDLAYRSVGDSLGKSTAQTGEKVQNTQIVVNMPGVMNAPRKTATEAKVTQIDVQAENTK